MEVWCIHVLNQTGFVDKLDNRSRELKLCTDDSKLHNSRMLNNGDNFLCRQLDKFHICRNEIDLWRYRCHKDYIYDKNTLQIHFSTVNIDLIPITKNFVVYSNFYLRFVSNDIYCTLFTLQVCGQFDVIF